MNTREAIAWMKGYVSTAPEGRGLTAMRLLLAEVERLSTPAPDAATRARAAAEALVEWDSDRGPKDRRVFRGTDCWETEQSAVFRLTELLTPHFYFPPAAPAAAPEPERPEPKYVKGQEVKTEGGKIRRVKFIGWSSVTRFYSYRLTDLDGRDDGWYTEDELNLSEPERPQPKYAVGQVVDDGWRTCRVIGARFCNERLRWLYDVVFLASGEKNWFYEHELKPHTMTVADLTPAQRRIQPGRKVRVKAIQNREDGGVIEGADRDEPNKEVTVLSMRPFQGAFVCIIHADTWCWPWNLELVEEGGA